MPTLGAFIRRRREELGFTQEQLAEHVGDGVRQAEISRLENDRVTLPRRHRLERIARALDVPIGTLLAKSGWAGADELDAQETQVLSMAATTEPIGQMNPVALVQATSSLLLSVLDGVEDGVAVVDFEGTIVISNDAYARYAVSDDPAAVFFDDEGRVVASAERWYGPIVGGDFDDPIQVTAVRGEQQVGYIAHAKAVAMDSEGSFRIITVKHCEDVDD